jgi:hypothetical protein
MPSYVFAGLVVAGVLLMKFAGKFSYPTRILMDDPKTSLRTALVALGILAGAVLVCIGIYSIVKAL